MLTDLVRWNPWKDMAFMQNRLNRIFDWGLDGLPGWSPAVDVFEKDGKMVIKAELPGLEKKDVHVDFKDGVLTLKGERRSENEVKEESYYRREIVSGSFTRAFVLPVDTDADQIKAEFANGVLTLEVPKPAASQPRQITVN